MKKSTYTAIAVGIITLTICLFAYYLSEHPEVVRQLQSVPPTTLLLLVLLYGAWFLALVLITRISLRMFRVPMGMKENLLFNTYSTLINFFGPGQSGPIFRAGYLKKRHNLSIKRFTLTTLMYYGFYAVISACFMFVGTRPLWQTLLLMAAVGSTSLILIRWYVRKKAHLDHESGINPFSVSLLFGATFLQMAAQVAIYAVELHSAGAHASFGQVLAYTGVANFALFVSLTPGAIGIREGFLLFSEGLHHLSSAAIVAANLIDRAVYLVFLGLLFGAALITHARQKLQITKNTPQS